VPNIRPTGGPDHDPKPFTDTRSVLIVVLALALSVGAGISTAVLTTAAGASTGLGVLAGVSTGGSAAVLIVAALHALIRNE
jgi:predicted ABC-type transport system involved in lysophospholipase L1 biosynthesis ATPase subunit